ncbi:MAG: alpha/beta hydrolase-fold protein [Oscillospiraceae bacterium]
MRTHIFGSGSTHIYIGIIKGEQSTAEEVCKLAKQLSGADFALIAFEAENWNDDLSPWEAPAVLGNEAFGGNASKTLEMLKNTIIPNVENMIGIPERRFIGGYSLSGLFALWCCCESELFDGAASCSGSLWFPKFGEYIEARPVPNGKFYFSLGDKEAKTKNKVMSTVEDMTLKIYNRFNEANSCCRFEFNNGGHFKDCALRLAKGTAFLAEQINQYFPQ